MDPLNSPIAVGRTAEIYAWKEGQVIKLFHNWFDLNSIQYEQRIARAIQDAGLPVPAVGEIVQVEGRNGLIYERVVGEPMVERLGRQPWRVWYFARQTAMLQAQMHTSSIQADIPSQRQKLAAKIRAAKQLPANLNSKALGALKTMPDGDRICHGDFHPGNIMVTAQEEVIIDWIDSTQGNPLADLARSTIILLGAADCQVGNLVVKTLIRVFHRVYRRAYFRLRPGGEVEYRQWLPIVAAARLSEGIPEIERWLIRWVEKELT